MLDLTNPIYTDNAAAIKHFEAIRWPDGVVCPHCGVVGNSAELKGKSTRVGLHKCRDCRKPFTAMMGTVYESSHIPMNLWLLATHLMCASKKGMSALQLQRMLNLKSYRSAWFMAHRIREAMTPGGNLPPLGSGGGVAEVDETYIGNKKGVQVRGGYRHKHAVLTLVERGGESRSFHVDSGSAKDVMPIIRANIAREAQVMTDEGKQYSGLKHEFSHATVNHTSGEYVRGMVHTNTVENFYSVFKRAMKGVYQHCGEQYLHRYVREFDFRYTNRIALGVDDEARTLKAIKGAEGKRLMLQGTQGGKGQPEAVA